MRSNLDLRSVINLVYPTPYFLVSQSAIRNKVEEFKTAFPDVELHYAMKANGERQVLEIISQLDCGFEVGSIYELRKLIALGVETARIIYGTAVKPRKQIQEAHFHGVNMFACDSLQELQKISEGAPNSKVFIRVSVDDGSSAFKFSEKFGTEKGMLVPLLLEARNKGLDPFGVSFHVGSQSKDPHAWSKAIQRLKEPITELIKEGIRLSAINIGGGFPCNYSSLSDNHTLQPIADSIHNVLYELPYPMMLFMEPGRAIVAEAVILVATVIAIVKRREISWLFLDAGVYNGLFESMAYQGSTKYRVTMLSDHKSDELMSFSIAGPTGDSPDIIIKDVMLPANIREGDKVVVHNTGAYTLSVCSDFNGFPKPNVYFID